MIKVTCQNMVGPGEVDEELEPEVKEECEGKYGEIVKVKIKEMPGVVEEEAVRIFLEFKRQECAIKGIVLFLVSEALIKRNANNTHTIFYSSCGPEWQIFWWERSLCLVL